MSERTANGAALRFVEDLKSLRLQQDVSLDDIRAVTRIPIDVLETFEGSALEGNKLFNRVYLRSLVRAYANTVGIDPDRATASLEDALAGTYDGQLLREPDPDPVAADAAEDEGDEDVRYEADDAYDAAAEVGTDVPYDAPVLPPPPRRTVYEDVSPATLDPADQPAPEPVAVADSWDAVSGSTRNPRVQPSRRHTPWGLIVSALAAIVLVGGGLIWWLSRPSGPDAPPAERVAVVDTVVQQPERVAPLTPVSLPDTLTLQLTAKNDSLSDGIQDIKVQVDDDLRRPYWMEKGQARTFRFVNRITVEQQLDDATLTLQGRPFPTTQTDASGRIVIDRDAALRHLQGR